MIKIPSYLQRAPSGKFHFRIAIPVRLRPYFDKRELRRTLGTYKRHEAIRLSRALANEAETAFLHAEGELMKKKKDPKGESIKRLKAKPLSEVVDSEFKIAFLNDEFGLLGKKPKPKTKSNQEEVKIDLLELSELPWSCKEVAIPFPDDPPLTDWLYTSPKNTPIRMFTCPDGRIVLEMVKDADLLKVMPMRAREVSVDQDGNIVLKDLDLDPDKLDTELKLLQGVVETVTNNSKTKPEHVHVPTPTPAPVQAETATEEPTTTIQQLINAYCDEKMRENAWRLKSEQENRSIYELFLRIIGNEPTSTMSYAKARDYKDVLQKLPPNLNKSIVYRSKSIQEIVTADPKKKMSIGTINKHLQRISSLFDWGKRHGYVKENFFSRLGLKNSKQARDERSVFEPEDLRKIMLPGKYRLQKIKHPHYYWLPWIGLLTGARINEICQLHLSDIREVDGVWVFDINDEKEKMLKSASSARLIPIHSKLIELGFMEYVEQLRTRKEDRLFPELKKQRDGYSQAASKWFGRYRRRVGVHSKTKAYHSFRHTVGNHLKQKGLPGEQIGAILGHKDESITTGRYGKEYGPAFLKEIVEQLEFDLSD
jgi:integrase